MSKPLRLLVTAFDYRPRLGGVATCADHLAGALSNRSDCEVMLVAPKMSGDTNHDQGRPFPIKRIHLPNEAFFTIPVMAKHLRRIKHEFKAEAILNTLWLPDSAATYLALQFSGHKTPYFILTHAVEVLESKRTLKKRIRHYLGFIKNRTFKKAEKIFAVSHFTKDLVIANTSALEQQVCAVFNGVDPLEFFPEPPREDLRTKFNLHGRNVLLTISRLVPNKGIDNTLAAIAQLGSEKENIAYLICGTGPDRERLEQIVRDYHLQDHVIFTGAIPPEELRDYYNLCDLFVLMSRQDLIAPAVEGFGIVFLESAACAKPTLGGRSGGIEDAIAEGISGWLADPADPRKIAEALKEALASGDELKLRGDQGRARVLNEFTWDHVADRVINVIKEGLK